MSGVRKSRWNPSIMNRPSPPWPISAVTVHQADRRDRRDADPGDDGGERERELDRRTAAAAPVAHALRRLPHSGWHTVEAGDGVPHQDQQRVGDERDERGVRDDSRSTGSRNTNSASDGIV